MRSRCCKARTARGLFHGAIVESGGTRSSEVVDTDRFPGATAAFLRAQTPAQLLAGYPENGKEGDRTGFYEIAQQFRDGVVLPASDAPAAFAAGSYTRVPAILGSNRDEAKLFMFASSQHVRRILGIPQLRDAEGYQREATYRSRFWKAYGVDEPAAAMRRVQGPSVYAYRFDWDGDWIRDVPTVLARAQSLGCSAPALASGN